jgi:dipeptidyl aminopeptidase/acylaminoacyl peptidase
MKTHSLISVAVVAAMAVLAGAQERTVPVTDNLIVEGIPPIPQSLAERVARYTEARSAPFAGWHPDRREMIVQTRFGDTAQVHKVQVPLGMRRQLTFFPEPIGSASHGPGMRDGFVFTKDIGGNEFYQIFRYDAATGDSTMLTDGSSRNGTPVWSNRGDRILYTSTRRTGADTDLWSMDPRSTRSDRMVKQLEGGGWWPIAWSPDDRSAVVQEYVSINESFLHLLDLGSGQMTPLTPKSGGEPVSYGGADFTRDGRQLYVTTDLGSEFMRLGTLDLMSRVFRPLTTDISWDVEEFALSPDRQTIAFVSNEAGIGVLRLLDTRTGRHRKVQNVPVGIVSSVQWHNNGRDLGFSVNSAQSPTDTYSVDVRTGRIDRWTHSETGGIDTDSIRAPELVSWKSFDGLEITGFLYRPPTRFTGPRPVIVNIHGGPESQARPGFIGRNNYYLNELGVAILYPNVRGSAGFGKTFLKLDNGFLRADSYKDIGSLFDWIDRSPELDGKRVLVTGGSYGGHMSFAISYLYPERISGSIPVVGMSNLVTFLENTADYRRDLRRVEYGDERDPKMREHLLSIAPMNHAEKITRPIFVIQGKNDPRVPFSEAQQFVDRIKGVNDQVWYLVATDEGHGFAKKRNADFQFYSTVMFVKRHLLGEQ